MGYWGPLICGLLLSMRLPETWAPLASGLGRLHRHALLWPRLLAVINSFSTNDTQIKRIELDVYGLESFGPEEQYEAAFSRDASIMVILSRGSYTDHPINLLFGTSQCNKIALYDVATGKLRLKKRPPGRG